MVLLNDLGDFLAWQVQAPINALLQLKATDQLAKLVEVIITPAKCHLGCGTTSEREAQASVQRLVGLQNPGQGLQKILDAFAPVDEAEIQQTHHIQVRQGSRRYVEIAVRDHGDPPVGKPHALAQAGCPEPGQGEQTIHAVRQLALLTQRERVIQHHRRLLQQARKAFRPGQDAGQLRLTPYQALGIVDGRRQRQRGIAHAQQLQRVELTQTPTAKLAMNQIDAAPVER